MQGSKPTSKGGALTLWGLVINKSLEFGMCLHAANPPRSEESIPNYPNEMRANYLELRDAIPIYRGCNNLPSKVSYIL